MHDSLPRWFVTCNADGQLRVHVAEKENDVCAGHARTRKSGACDGLSTPPLRSSVTITCSPGSTRCVSLTRPPAKVPAARTSVPATHASYVFPFGARRQRHRQHSVTRRRDDECAGLPGQREPPRLRIAQHARRGALLGQRVLECRRPDAETDRCRTGRDRERSGDRHRSRPAIRAARRRSGALPGPPRRCCREARPAARALRRRRGRMQHSGGPRARSCTARSLRDAPRSAPARRRPARRGRRGRKAREGRRAYRSEPVFAQDPRTVRRCYSSGSFWTLCAVAYSSVRVFTTSIPSP